MKQPNILMYHRIELSNTNSISDLYYKRNMVSHAQSLFNTIDTYLQNGLKFGSIESCLKFENCFHLSFDDGFKEHLEIAKNIKQKYKPDYDCITFSINVGNSYFRIYTGMALIYSIYANNKQSKLFNLLHIKQTTDLQKIKKHIFTLHKNDILALSNQFPDLYPKLQNTFLTESEIVKLSKYFSIASHGITHRYLTADIENSKIEIQQSKKIIDSKINRSIDTFCYPEGKNNLEIQKYCFDAGYKFALSIKHEHENNYCIGRVAK